MRRVCQVVVLLIAAGWWAGAALAKEFKLENGSVIEGEVGNINEDGLVVRLKSTGGFANRVPWGRLTQETLKMLLEEPDARQYVEPFIEIPREAKPKPKPIVVRDVPRVELPTGRPALMSFFFTPLGLMVLGALYLANLYSAYEVAIFRHHPVSLVCGVSALIPLGGPLAFLASPSGEPATTEASTEVATFDAAGEVVNPMANASVHSGLRVAGEQKAVNTGPMETKVWNRGDTTFNRRFFEAQFSGFFRIVPGEAEKDAVLVIRTPKEEYTAKRISRISSNEMHVALVHGGNQEMRVVFSEIAQVILRHKDAKA